ncbi:MAG: glucose-1-phosphate adenylyltransferase family protein [Mycoplasmatales bacterium]
MKEIIVMLLAGGRGERLQPLTDELPKPLLEINNQAIIEFSIKNCLNANITEIGLLIQYQTQKFIDYFQTRATKTEKPIITLLQPKTEYAGTADAIFQNIDYFQAKVADYVLILSADHVYEMDYQAILEEHQKKQADVTVCATPVPKHELSRFGIITEDKNQKIINFQEKPKVANSSLASMGIYLFNKQFLIDTLIADNKNQSSTHDFGHDIFPTILNQTNQIYTYHFNDYWQDIGTIKSYLQTNYDFNNEPNNVIFDDVSVGENTQIYNSVILPSAQIGANCQLKFVIVERGAIVKSNTKIEGKINDIIVISKK